MNLTRKYDLADLHEDVLEFLLTCKRNKELVHNFSLRPSFNERHKAKLNEGWWFFGNKNFVNLYFTKNVKGPSYLNNFHFTIDTLGKWKIAIQLKKSDYVNKELLNFSNSLEASFGHIGKRQEEENEISRKINNDKYYINPYSTFYRDGLPEAINIIDGVFEQKFFKSQNWLQTIDDEEYISRLDFINNLRKKKSQVFLSGFKIQNYHGLKETELKEIPSNTPWIFLTGENGFGKTSLLQSITIGLYGNTEDIIIPKNKDVKIEVAYQQRNQIRNSITWTIVSPPDFFLPLKKITCYGPSRLQLQSQQSKNEESKSSTATYSLFNLDGHLKNIEYELFASFYDNPKKFDVIQKALKKVIPSLAKIDLEKKERRILYYEKDKDSDELTYEPVGFEELASGIKSIIAMVGDIYLRLSLTTEKNKGNFDDSTILSPKELTGIVIVDELDLHLHPKWQKRLPTLLSEVFPKVQFIASTHSPIPLLGAPKGSIFLKVNRSTEDGITVEKLEIDIEDLTPNLILSSPIFGFTEIFPVTHEKGKRIRTEDTMEEMKEEDELVEELKSYIGTDKEERLKRLLKS